MEQTEQRARHWEIPTPLAATWFDEVKSYKTVADIRTRQLTLYPVFTRRTLQRIAVVGAADEGRRLVELCHVHGINVALLCDDNQTQQGQRIGLCSVAPVESLADLDRDVPVIIASHRAPQTFRRLRKMGFQTVVLFAVLQAMDPEWFPPHMFYDGWLEDLIDHRDSYAQLLPMLSDDESRRTLNAIIGFRITGDPEVLAPVIDWEVYAPNDLIELTNDEVYVDGGAFDGDTVRLFMQRVGEVFARILAFEPDPQTYLRLKANFVNEPRVELINKGLHRGERSLPFDNAGTRGSILTKDGGIEIGVISLDEVLKRDRVTYIKMNIEGAELEALRGAQSSIRRWAPRLAISAYHRPTDLWQVPFLIRELRPAYNICMRQHDGGVIETVAYGI